MAQGIEPRSYAGIIRIRFTSVISGHTSHPGSSYASLLWHFGLSQAVKLTYIFLGFYETTGCSEEGERGRSVENSEGVLVLGSSTKFR